MIKQIVVIAGGKGTRLYPLTKKNPKSLITIKKIPFIDYQLKKFEKNHIQDVVLCLGKFSEMIIKYLNNNSKFKLNFTYSNENPNNPLGTLGALKKAEKILDEKFFVIWGDSFLDIDFQKVGNKFTESKKLGLMTIYKNKNKMYPNNVASKYNEITEYEKNQLKKFEFIDYGLSVFNKKVLDFFPKNKNLDISELNQYLISKNQLASLEMNKKFFEIGSFEGIQDFEKYLK
jgi:N-acetyl-alpha-D-muramate 1-phosphate uridylyltransferase